MYPFEIKVHSLWPPTPKYVRLYFLKIGTYNLLILFYLFLKRFIYLFIIDIEREREAETQAEGEAGEPDVRLNLRTLRS